MLHLGPAGLESWMRLAGMFLAIDKGVLAGPDDAMTSAESGDASGRHED